MLDEPLLAVKDLTTEISRPGGLLRAVDGVSLTVRTGEAVALVGESGSGKSATALSILSLVPDPPARITGGEVLFKGEDLLLAGAERLRQIRGDQIGMVFQEPAAALNPVLTVGEQVAETVRAHREVGRAEARRRAVQLLTRVGIPDAKQRYRAYPHQLSGGMQQRVLLAAAMICEPDLLIADEPTSALDVTTQAQIMELLRELQQGEQTALALLLISHDLALVADLCDRVVVLYAGAVVEQGPCAAIFGRPAHPYTAALLRSIRSFDDGGRPRPLVELAGAGTALPETGCRFAPRCDLARAACRADRSELRPAGEGRSVRCLFPLLPEQEGEA